MLRSNTHHKTLRRAAWLCVAMGAAGCGDVGSKSDVPAIAEAAIVANKASGPPHWHPLGSIPDSPTTLGAHAMAAQVVPLVLASSVDLSSELPPVGDQGSEGSCVGWAVAYSAKTLLDVVQNNWPPDDETHEFSPSWIYNQINGGVDKGSNMSTALTLVVNSGVDTMSSFPYVNGDYLTQPSTDSKARAAHFKAASWATVSVSATNFKNQLAAGKPVIVTLNILPDFDAMNSSNSVYDTDMGTRGGWVQACDANCT